MHNDNSTLRNLLQQCQTIAVVGLSAEWHRPSFFAAKYMQSHGYKIIPVNPRYAATGQQILGETVYASLLDIPQPVGMVDIFRRTEDVLPLAEEAIRIGAKCLWQQLGVQNLEADQLVRQAGLASVYNRCVKIEHARLFGVIEGSNECNTPIFVIQRGQRRPLADRRKRLGRRMNARRHPRYDRLFPFQPRHLPIAKRD